MNGSTANVISASFQFIHSMMPTIPTSTNTSSKMDTDARSEHLVQSVDVGGDARDQPADRILVVESDMHALQVAENLAAQVEHHFLPGPLHEVGLQELEHEGEHQQAEINCRNLRDPVQRPAG